MRFPKSIFNALYLDEADKAAKREAENMDRLKKQNAGLKAWNNRITKLLIRQRIK